MTPPDRATAFWIESPRRGGLRVEPLPSLEGVCAETLVRVRTLYSAVSRGTETLVWRGQVPASEYQRMRAPFQQGDFPGPVKYGYSNVGIIEAGPADWVGRTVFCLYPHQDHYVVPLSNVHPLPAGTPAARAVLAANMETAVNALWDAGPRIGDRVAVVGGGVVGMLTAWLAARIPGCRVQVVDIDPSRAAVAQALGAELALPGQARPDADLVVHASGSGSGLQCALDLAGFEAVVLEMSWYGSQTVELALGQAFHARRLQLRSTQVGTVAGVQRARWDTRRRMALALELLADDRLDALIGGEHRFVDLPDVMNAIDRGELPSCQRILYD